MVSSWPSQVLAEWNARYKQKFGHIFIICASGRSTVELLAELKRRCSNRPIVEIEIAAAGQMKVTELRLANLFSTKARATSTGVLYPTVDTQKAGDRVSIIGARITADSEAVAGKPSRVPAQNRPPITTHVLDTAKESPAAGIEVNLEMWKGT
ncbi:hypothetical protein SLEP1_g6018 [Rubroshorea leprosula]|uniref:2-oxo-4-hydroxy-4-carboxy-5-ureidoimidazoline decarboxylase n=1 Tax=Rubroshorea leprosula TaxID=152421 RepID=A0AAV5I1Y5_9ROSI|nr:hypothetical protein SLEP1_g6018 [Rubroshorea leprosula]